MIFDILIIVCLWLVDVLPYPSHQLMCKNKLHVCTYWFTLRFVNFFVEISRLCGTRRFWQIWNQLTLSQPEGGRLCSSNYNWPPTPRIFKPSYSPVQNLLNVIYLSEPKVLTNIVANSGWPRKPGFKSEKKMFGVSPNPISKKIA